MASARQKYCPGQMACRYAHAALLEGGLCRAVALFEMFGIVKLSEI